MTIFCHPANAETGYDLFMRCQRGDNSADVDQNGEANRCVAYLSGIWDGMVSIENKEGIDILCPSHGVQRGQLTLIFMEWARQHPQSLNVTAADAALSSFSAAFPCRR